MDTAKPTYQRTRIAPTPSGFLHLGNVLSFALTASLARRSGARILLRIDDLDRERVKPAYVQDVFDTLDFLEIPWDEGPRNCHEYETEYSQLHRMHLYENALQQLRQGGSVFACDCSRSEVMGRHPDGFYTGTCKEAGLSLEASGLNWRLDTSADRVATTFTDWNGRVHREALPGNMQYFVVRKRDGFPAYQLASVLDDVHFGVDLVVRGADLWDSTVAQSLLAGRLGLAGFQHAGFFHHDLLMAATDEKFSKSAGATSIQHYRKAGKTKAAVFEMIGNMLGLPQPAHSWEALGDALFTPGGRYAGPAQ